MSTKPACVGVLVDYVVAPVAYNTLPVALAANVLNAPVAFPTNKLPAVNVPAPLPPLATGNMPDTALVKSNEAVPLVTRPFASTCTLA